MTGYRTIRIAGLASVLAKSCESKACRPAGRASSRWGRGRRPRDSRPQRDQANAPACHTV